MVFRTPFYMLRENALRREKSKKSKDSSAMAPGRAPKGGKGCKSNAYQWRDLLVNALVMERKNVGS